MERVLEGASLDREGWERGQGFWNVDEREWWPGLGWGQWNWRGEIDSRV